MKQYKPIPLDLFDTDTREFFWAHIEILKPGECWLWKYGESVYGCFFLLGHLLRAHRVAWVLTHEQQIPDGQLIRHLCHEKRCCNPAHLEPGTQSDNMKDTVGARIAIDKRRVKVGLRPLWSREVTS